MEDEFDHITGSSGDLHHFQKSTGLSQASNRIWENNLPKLLREQHTTLNELVKAEVANERKKFERKQNIAHILLKPTGDLTEEEIQTIAARVQGQSA